MLRVRVRVRVCRSAHLALDGDPFGLLTGSCCAVRVVFILKAVQATNAHRGDIGHREVSVQSRVVAEWLLARVEHLEVSAEAVCSERDRVPELKLVGPQ